MNSWYWLFLVLSGLLGVEYVLFTPSWDQTPQLLQSYLGFPASLAILIAGAMLALHPFLNAVDAIHRQELGDDFPV